MSLSLLAELRVPFRCLRSFLCRARAVRECTNALCVRAMCALAHHTRGFCPDKLEPSRDGISVLLCRLWAMGSPITEERLLYAALNNCAFVSTDTVKDVSCIHRLCCFACARRPLLCSARLFGCPTGVRCVCCGCCPTLRCVCHEPSLTSAVLLCACATVCSCLAGPLEALHVPHGRVHARRGRRL